MSKESKRKHKWCTENEKGVIFTAMKDIFKVIRKQYEQLCAYTFGHEKEMIVVQAIYFSKGN